MSSSCESSSLNWKRWLRPFALTLYFLALVVVVPVVVWQLQSHHASVHTKAWFISGIVVVFTLPVCLWGILQHVVHFSRPELQKPILRILCMVPVYSLASWGCLLWPDHATYLESLRDFYEAFAIYNFLGLLVNFLQAQHPELDALLEAKEPQRLSMPFCWCPRGPVGPKLLCRCKLAVLQYVILTVVGGIVAGVCEYFDAYRPGTFDLRSPWMYLAIANFLSEIVSVSALRLFHKTLKEELKPLQPGGKFACLEGVISLTFWQAVVIAALKGGHVIAEGPTWDWHTPETVGSGLQNFATVLEMFLAALLFQYSYSYTPYMRDQRRGTFWSLFLEIWDITDIKDDVVAQAKELGTCLCGNTRGVQTEEDACVVEMAASTPDTGPPMGASPSSSPGNQPDLGQTLPSLY